MLNPVRLADETVEVVRTRKTADGVNLITASAKPSAMVKTFDDTATDTYFDPANPMGNVLTAGSGVKIRVVKQSKNAQVQTLQVVLSKVGFKKFKK